jgi:hypothetical protein
MMPEPPRLLPGWASLHHSAHVRHASAGTGAFLLGYLGSSFNDWPRYSDSLHLVAELSHGVV